MGFLGGFSKRNRVETFRQGSKVIVLVMGKVEAMYAPMGMKFYMLIKVSH